MVKVKFKVRDNVKVEFKVKDRVTVKFKDKFKIIVWSRSRSMSGQCQDWSGLVNLMVKVGPSLGQGQHKVKVKV